MDGVWRSGGLKTEIYENIEQLIWEKLLCNVTLSGPCSIFGCNVKELKNNKEYWRHTGYPGGQKVMNFKTMKDKYPDRIIASAVKGMLPHNRLGRSILTHLKVYTGSEHPHSAQQPKVLEF